MSFSCKIHELSIWWFPTRENSNAPTAGHFVNMRNLILWNILKDIPCQSTVSNFLKTRGTVIESGIEMIRSTKKCARCHITSDYTIRIKQKNDEFMDSHDMQFVLLWGSTYEMTINEDCPHRMAVNSTMCKYCGQPQCDLCRKEHLAIHVANFDKELQPEDMW